MKKAALLWLVVLVIESFVVTVLFRDLIAGTWEVRALRYNVIPLVWLATLPLVVGCSLLVGIARRAAVARRWLGLLTGLVFAAAGGVAWLLSTGRHFERIAVRMAFVTCASIVASMVTFYAWPKIARLSVGRQSACALVIVCAAWLGDAFVLAHLYPAFHWSLAVVTLLATAWVASHWALPRWAERAAAAILVAIASASAMRAVSAKANLRYETNLRVMLVERAPLLGKGVLALSLATAESETGAPSVDVAPREAGRALDWSGRDLLLISVDALRADHSSLYGYSRPTTPELSKLAKEGMTFEYAYAPTPHTSYSITSLMTGKYMRPLVALGAAADSETWATLARHYGYRTAAFYPPAVFFIDTQRFVTFQDTRLGFEYAKVEFADASKRVLQLERYLVRASSEKPVFAWVHLFEPHEPYVRHDAHALVEARAPIDDYDSEIRAADASIGALVHAFRAKRPKATVMVTADHGEEFNEHGGRYHGTSVYEEQVRVPLVIVGEGIGRGVRSLTVVQTIDMLPTVLSAWGAPRPARVRGRDLGPVLTGKEVDEGLAYAEAEHMTLLARGGDRLVCERRLRACSLFDVQADPLERRDVSAVSPVSAQRATALKAMLQSVEASHGRFELSQVLPDVLRRALQGDHDAALDASALLDDANVEIRRKAAEAMFVLHARELRPHLERVLVRETDEPTRRFAVLALVRSGETRPEAQTLLADADRGWRRRAAIALGAQMGPAGAAEFRAWLAEPGVDLDLQKDLIAGLAAVRDRESVSLLINKLDNVTLRAAAAAALAAIGDQRAKARLVELFEKERYIANRGPLALAAIALGATKELYLPLAHFAGTPEPLSGALQIAARAGIVGAKRSGFVAKGWPVAPGPLAANVVLSMGPETAGRLWLSARCPTVMKVGEQRRELPASQAYVDLAAGRTTVELSCSDGKPGIEAAWIVALTAELPPPPPEPWDGGLSDED
jgi:arylsulfatase A-like enzyme